MSRYLYLDHLSTTPLDPRVFSEMEPFFREQYGNPANLHRPGLAARKAVQKARSEVRSFLKAPSEEEIIFTSGGTESANLAVKGLARELKHRGSHLVVSAVEHPSVLRSARALEQEGFSLTLVAADSSGKIDPAEVEKALQPSTILVAVQYANHDLGTIQPAAEIGAITRARGIPFFCDATAGGGWVPIDVSSLQADLLSLSPHRFFGPKGSGVLYCRRGISLHPLLDGGRQEEGRRAGVENVAAIAGTGAACRLASEELTERAAKTSLLQKIIAGKIPPAIPHSKWIGPDPGKDRLPHHFAFAFEFIEAEALMLLLDLNGVALTGGTGCVTRDLKISPSIAATGLSHQLAQGVVLGGFAPEQTAADIDSAIAAIEKSVGKLRSMSLNWQDFQNGKLKPELP